MRITMIGRFLAMLMLLGGMLAMPVFDTQVASVVADEDKDESRQDEKDDDKDDDKDKGKDKDKEKKDKEEGKDKDEDGDDPAINSSAGYTIEVACEYDDSADITTCTFTGVEPEGEKNVSHVDLSEDAVCAEVLGGDHEYVDPDPNTRVTGYKSRGSEGTFTLELQGEVTVGGTTTYWFKTGDGVFPANGPGLDCDGASANAQVETGSTAATAETTVFDLQTTPGSAEAPATAETGELVVLIYTCADVPVDTTGFDWFGMCDPEAGVHQLALAPVSGTTAEPVTMGTNESGDATFSELEAGTYSLDLTEGSWCKAVSDNVDAQGNVIIEAGARTTVYAFMCEGTPKP